MEFVYLAMLGIAAIVVLSITSQLAKTYAWARYLGFLIVILMGYYGWGAIFPSSITNEPLRAAIEKYVRVEFRSIDLGLDAGVREHRIEDITLLRDRVKDGQGSAKARISGTYTLISNEGNADQKDFDVEHTFTYLIRDEAYIVESHIPLPRLFK